MFVCDLCGTMFETMENEKDRRCPDCNSDYTNHVMCGFSAMDEDRDFDSSDENDLD